MLGRAHTGPEMAWGPAGQRSLPVCCRSPPGGQCLAGQGRGPIRAGITDGSDASARLIFIFKRLKKKNYN